MLNLSELPDAVGGVWKVVAGWFEVLQEKGPPCFVLSWPEYEAKVREARSALAVPWPYVGLGEFSVQAVASR